MLAASAAEHSLAQPPGSCAREALNSFELKPANIRQGLIALRCFFEGHDALKAKSGRAPRESPAAEVWELRSGERMQTSTASLGGVGTTASAASAPERPRAQAFPAVQGNSIPSEPMRLKPSRRLRVSTAGTRHKSTSMIRHVAWSCTNKSTSMAKLSSNWASDAFPGPQHSWNWRPASGSVPGLDTSSESALISHERPTAHKHHAARWA